MRPMLQLVFLVLCLAVVVGENSFASFQQNQRRYLSPYDIISLFRQKFPINERKGMDDCLAISGKNRALIGGISPFNGQAFNGQPGHVFVNWYGNCLLKLIQLHFEQRQVSVKIEEGIVHLYGEGFLNHWRKGSGERIKNVAWSGLPVDVQIGIISHWSQNLIGLSDVIKDLSGQGDDKVFYRDILRAMTKTKYQAGLSEATQHVIFLIAMKDEFLMY